MDKNLRKFIIRMMVNETNPDLVLKLLLQDYNIVKVVGDALINDCSIKEIMEILSDENRDLSERINDINMMKHTDNNVVLIKR